MRGSAGVQSRRGHRLLAAPHVPLVFLGAGVAVGIRGPAPPRCSRRLFGMAFIESGRSVEIIDETGDSPHIFFDRVHKK